MARDPLVLRQTPEEWAADTARLRAAMGEPALLWEADAGDVITIPGHWPVKVAVDSVRYSRTDQFSDRQFLWLTWHADGFRGREEYSEFTRIGMVAQADRPPADDDTLAELAARLNRKGQ